jgi:hypothetical protein
MRVQVVVGQTYGRWTVVAESELRGNERYYACVCNCGTHSAVRKSILVAAKSGCAKCATRTHSITHGKTQSFEFGVWAAMKKRCQYAKHPHYGLYGGRGITITPAWLAFEAFFADMGVCPYGGNGSIDRIDSDKNYTPENCRWVLRSAQAKNRRNVHLIDGKTLPDLALELGVKYTTLKRRVTAGWPRDRWGRTPQELGTRS